MNHSALYISQAEMEQGSEGSANLKDFLMHVDRALSWRATFSDDEFEELKSKPKLKIFVQPGLDLSGRG